MTYSVSWCIVASTFLVGVLNTAVAQTASTGNVAVLAQWAQVSGQAAPQIVEQTQGGTKLIWTQQLSVDAYHSESSGSSTLTGVRNGDFYGAQWQSDLRQEKEGESLDWLMFSASASNDRLAQQQDQVLSNLQAGRSTQSYRIAAGDISVDHSTLGARSALRGVYGESRLGKANVSVAAGLQTESWQSLEQKALRQTPLREAYALKVMAPVHDAVNVYATSQGYSDQEDSVALSVVGQPIQRALANTVGMDYTQEKWTLSGELGQSVWGVDAADGKTGQAAIVDGRWQGENNTVRMGHHDISALYAALSSDVVPGVRETYVDTSWAVVPTVAFSGGVRYTRNAIAADTVNPSQGALTEHATAMNVAVNWDVSAITGLQLQALAATSRGRNFDQGAVTRSSHGLSARYPRGDLETSLGWQAAELANAATPFSDARTITWNTGLGWRNNSDAQRHWNVGSSAQYVLQQQEFVSGVRNTNRSWTLSVDAEHPRWGTLRASGQWGDLRNTATGDVQSQALQIDATQSYGAIGSFKLYMRTGQSRASGVSANYDERVLGLQWLLALQ